MVFFIFMITGMVLTCTWLVFIRAFAEKGLMNEATGVFLFPGLVIGLFYFLVIKPKKDKRLS